MLMNRSIVLDAIRPVGFPREISDDMDGRRSWTCLDLSKSSHRNTVAINNCENRLLFEIWCLRKSESEMSD
jgi:hypothetical protein